MRDDVRGRRACRRAGRCPRARGRTSRSETRRWRGGDGIDRVRRRVGRTLDERRAAAGGLGVMIDSAAPRAAVTAAPAAAAAARCSALANGSHRSPRGMAVDSGCGSSGVGLRGTGPGCEAKHSSSRARASAAREHDPCRGCSERCSRSGARDERGSLPSATLDQHRALLDHGRFSVGRLRLRLRLASNASPWSTCARPLCASLHLRRFADFDFDFIDHFEGAASAVTPAARSRRTRPQRRAAACATWVLGTGPRRGWQRRSGNRPVCA